MAKQNMLGIHKLPRQTVNLILGTTEHALHSWTATTDRFYNISQTDNAWHSWTATTYLLGKIGFAENLLGKIGFPENLLGKIGFAEDLLGKIGFAVNC
jgi:hypothetical protein